MEYLWIEGKFYYSFLEAILFKVLWEIIIFCSTEFPMGQLEIWIEFFLGLGIRVLVSGKKKLGFWYLDGPRAIELNWTEFEIWGFVRD